MTYIKVKRKQANTGNENIVFDIRPVLAARGITQVHGFFKKSNLSINFIQQCSDGKVKTISNKQMAILCQMLKCEPGDFFKYVGPPIEDVTHHLHAFSKKQSEIINPKQFLEQANLDQIKKNNPKLRIRIRNESVNHYKTRIWI